MNQLVGIYPAILSCPSIITFLSCPFATCSSITSSSPHSHQQDESIPYRISFLNLNISNTAQQDVRNYQMCTATMPPLLRVHPGLRMLLEVSDWDTCRIRRGKSLRIISWWNISRLHSLALGHEDGSKFEWRTHETSSCWLHTRGIPLATEINTEFGRGNHFSICRRRKSHNYREYNRHEDASGNLFLGGFLGKGPPAARSTQWDPSKDWHMLQHSMRKLLSEISSLKNLGQNRLA